MVVALSDSWISKEFEMASTVGRWTLQFALGVRWSWTAVVGRLRRVVSSKQCLRDVFYCSFVRFICVFKRYVYVGLVLACSPSLALTLNNSYPICYFILRLWLCGILE